MSARFSDRTGMQAKLATLAAESAGLEQLEQQRDSLFETLESVKSSLRNVRQACCEMKSIRNNHDELKELLSIADYDFSRVASNYCAAVRDLILTEHPAQFKVKGLLSRRFTHNEWNFQEYKTAVAAEMKFYTFTEADDGVVTFTRIAH